MLDQSTVAEIERFEGCTQISCPRTEDWFVEPRASKLTLKIYV